MSKEIKFKKERIFFGMFFFVSLLAISISFLLKPDIYIRNVFIKIEHIEIVGTIGVVYFSILPKN